MTDDLPADWDPPKADREHFDSLQTGDRGWKVRRGGRWCVKLDRPMEDIVRVYNEGDWKPVAERRPMNKAQLVQVAFDADKKLRSYLGITGAEQTWIGLHEEQRRAWLEKGPTGHPDRKKLYRAIMGALGHLAE